MIFDEIKSVYSLIVINIAIITILTRRNLPKSSTPLTSYTNVDSDINILSIRSMIARLLRAKKARSKRNLEKNSKYKVEGS